MFDRMIRNTVRGDVRISTVFLGIDHNFSGKGLGVYWETMVFGGPFNGEEQRYTSLNDAVVGHMAFEDRFLPRKSSWQRFTNWLKG